MKRLAAKISAWRTEAHDGRPFVVAKSAELRLCLTAKAAPAPLRLLSPPEPLRWAPACPPMTDSKSEVRSEGRAGNGKRTPPNRAAFSISRITNQRLENWGARRAAFRPYCAGPQTRIHCGATVSEFKSVSHRKFNLKQCAVSLRPVARLCMHP